MFGSSGYKSASGTASVVEAHQWADGRPRNSGEFLEIAPKNLAQVKAYLGKQNLVWDNARLIKNG